VGKDNWGIYTDVLVASKEVCLDVNAEKKVGMCSCIVNRRQGNITTKIQAIDR